jgi:trehalose-6-phosphatase
MKIDAILSDYDGTLCPTSSISQDNSNSSRIPERLEKILWNISEKIDVCIVSSKDFGFLRGRTKFAKIVSCILGIETLVLKRHKLEALMGENKEDDILKPVLASQNAKTNCNAYCPVIFLQTRTSCKTTHDY